MRIRHFHLATALAFLSPLAFHDPARAQATTIRVSVASDGSQGNGLSGLQGLSISADGRFVAFSSSASNLVAGDTNGALDVFVRDTAAGTTRRVSVASDGTQGNGGSIYPSISADGRFVAFQSEASNLESGDTNGYRDVFVRDTAAGTTTRVSVASDGSQGNYMSSGDFGVSISADGRTVAFVSDASNLVAGDTNEMPDVFVRDTVAGTTTRVSVASDGTQGSLESIYPSISADGRTVAFVSYSSNLVAGDTTGPETPQVFVRDLAAGTTRRVSVASDGSQQRGASSRTSISADGRYVAFESFASNLVAGDTNLKYDVFVRDTAAAKTTRVSVASDGSQANNGSGIRGVSFSADGRTVAFVSAASNLVAGDTNGKDYPEWGGDVFVHDRYTFQTTRVSVASDGSQGNNSSGYHGVSISADGRTVAFQSEARNLVAGDTNGMSDVFVRGPLPQPPALYTVEDAVTALRVAGGLYGSPDMERLNVHNRTAETLDLSDAALIARKAAGLEVNP